MVETADQAPETFDILGSGRRTERQLRIRRGAEILVGISLLALGIRRPFALGILLGAAGGALVIRGLTGKRLTSLVRQLPEHVRTAVRGRRQDGVDEALLGTFPASDPPSY